MKKYPFVRCLHPKRLTNPYTYERLIVRCGHCDACNLARSSRYVSLLNAEDQSAVVRVFVTLTYAPKYRPFFRVESTGSDTYDCFSDDGEYYGNVQYGSLNKMLNLMDKVDMDGRIPCLSKTDLQKFFKRLRKRYGKKNFKYFACGEYTPKHFYPHYHVVFYFSDNEAFSTSGKTLSEFPPYTWSKQDVARCTSRTQISDFEYALRKSWPFGRVDCSVISAGTCASYVASYVSGSNTLPSVFGLPKTKQFCCHSRYLGRQIFREEFARYIFSPVDEVVKRVISDGKEYREVFLSRENYTAVFPRCKGFTSFSHEKRLFVFTIYNECRRLYGDFKPIEFSRLIANFLISGSSDPVSDYFYLSVSYKKRLSDFLLVRSDLDDVASLQDEEFFNHLVYSIYTELLISKMFCDNALYLKTLDIPFEYSSFDGSCYELYLTLIERFYDRLDYLHLTAFYKDQEDYFALSYAQPDDVPYFYNNGVFDFGSFMESFAYRAFSSDVYDRVQRSVKHKVLNDMNKIFL